MKKVFLALGLGVLLGEIVFLSLSPAGEDFWAHYLTAQHLVGRISQRDLQDMWPYPHGYDQLAFEALLVVPLSFLSPLPALLLWTGVSYLAIAAATYLWVKDLERKQPLGVAATTLLFLIWPVTFVHIFRGQITSLFLLALVASYLLGLRKREELSGLVLSLGLIKPHLVAGVVAGVVLKSKWRVLSGFLIGSLLLFIASLRVTLPEIETNFQNYLTRWFLGNPLSISLVGRFHFLSWPLQATASALGLLVLAMWWWRKHAPTLYDAAFGFLISFLLIPHLRVYDLVALIPIFTLLLPHRDPLVWTSLLLLSIGGVGSLRFALLDLVTLSLILLVISLWRNRAPQVATQKEQAKAGKEHKVRYHMK